VNDTTWMSRILPLAGAETVLKLKAPQEWLWISSRLLSNRYWWLFLLDKAAGAQN
jgi:hypothetical protein